MNKLKFFKKTALTFILLVYLIILTKLILFKYIPLTEIIHHFNFTYTEYFWRSNNFVPFKTIYFYLFLAEINLNSRIENLVGNVVGFIPFGFILPLLSKRFMSFKSILAVTFTSSLSYELLQLIFELGSFDVDDLILNTFGGLVGYILVRIFLFIIRPRKKQAGKNKKVG